MTELSIIGLYKDYFGITPEQFKFDQLAVPSSVSSKNLALYQKDAVGRTYFMPVWIGSADNDLQLLPYPTVTVTEEVHIIDTPLAEQNGSVSEFISISSYKFTIRGLMIDHNGQWPEDQITALHNLLKIQQVQQMPLTIRSGITDIFLLTEDRSGWDKVTIRHITYPPGRADIKVRAYEMELISDEPFSLIEV